MSHDAVLAIFKTHPRLSASTRTLVKKFAEALAGKLFKAQEKYGWKNDWAKDDWMVACQTSLAQHIIKGDPLDVAAYAAFCWHHGWSSAGETVQSALQKRNRSRASKGFLGYDRAPSNEIRARIRQRELMSPSADKPVREAIRFCREQRNLTQQDFAALMGCGKAKICEIETGHSRMTVAFMFKAAAVLGVEPVSLLGDYNA